MVRTYGKVDHETKARYKPPLSTTGNKKSPPGLSWRAFRCPGIVGASRTASFCFLSFLNLRTPPQVACIVGRSFRRQDCRRHLARRPYNLTCRAPSALILYNRVRAGIGLDCTDRGMVEILGCYPLHIGGRYGINVLRVVRIKIGACTRSDCSSSQ